MRRILIYIIVALLLLPLNVEAQSTLPRSVRDNIARMLTVQTLTEVSGGYVKVTEVRVRKQGQSHRIEIYASRELAYFPMREHSVKEFYKAVRSALPEEYHDAELRIYTDGHLIDDLVPQYYATAADTLRFRSDSVAPLVRASNPISRPDAGLQNRHIALWQSHGRYYNNRIGGWGWQRSRLWESVEDIFTQSFVVPYLMPMLERSGAVVLLPRERSMRSVEVIIDNDQGIDTGCHYIESGARYDWTYAGKGFAHLHTTYPSGHNPFEDGTVRKVECVERGKRTSTASWGGRIPESGIYTLYVSYRSLASSVTDARYVVHTAGGEREFLVNQRMGGGMWVPLGEFYFEAGDHQHLVTLHNDSAMEGVVTADAIKIGGGMGNVARGPQGGALNVSGSPRFVEGSRYWLQWSGFDEDVYAARDGEDDYKEDYMSRAHWVNALMGGSSNLRYAYGKSIPIDLAIAFHSDAGVRLNDDIVGTLGIYSTMDDEGYFSNGVERMRSRDLTDIIMTQIVGDIRATYEPQWMRRGMWDRAYYEARKTQCPTLLLELLSHQNFADMRYGLDPSFRFLVSRAIYKGALRFLASQYGVEYVVHPLPIRNFAVHLDNERALLEWEPTVDVLEPTALPDYYILYTRVDGGGFDAGRRVDGCSVEVEVEAGRIYDFRLTAVNRGGESFDSETLSVGRARRAKGTVLIVNGFDRVSAPVSRRSDTEVGFYNEEDGGVPYIEEIAYTGNQYIFDLAMARCEDDSKALGASHSGYEGVVLGGNTFCYPSLHGKSILAAGYSFCSASRGAVEGGSVALDNYDVVDLILGKQRTTAVGRGASGYRFVAYGEALQQALEGYAERGGDILVSGACHLTDLYHSPLSDDEDRAWAERVLRVAYGGCEPVEDCQIYSEGKALGKTSQRFDIATTLAANHYAIERADVVIPAGRSAETVLYYDGDNRYSAGVLSAGGGARTAVLGFPIELVEEDEARHSLMASLLKYLTRKR